MVLLVIFGVTFGGWITAGVIAEQDGAVTVAGTVRIQPPTGWSWERFQGDDFEAVRLSRGSATLDVFVLAFEGDERALIDHYVREALEPDATQLQVSDRIEELTAGDSEPAIRTTYVGTFEGVSAPIEGELTAVVTDGGAGVLFDGWSPHGQLAPAIDDIHGMIESAEFAG